MSYTPTTWAAGDTVTAAKLNKLEQGVAAGGGVLVVHDVNGTLDKTWQEIADAGFAVLYVPQSIPVVPPSVYVLCSIKDDEDKPFVRFYCGNAQKNLREYDATSKNDYPVYVD